MKAQQAHLKKYKSIFGIIGQAMHTVTCPQCGIHPKGFMVKDEIWQSCGLCTGTRIDGWWCLECFESKLKRKITLSDLINVPLNYWLFYEFSNGLR